MEKPAINFKYKFQDNYNPTYINGVYGGIGSHGEIVANFYLERPPIPYMQTVEIKGDGFLGQEVEFKPDDHHANIVRYVSTGVVMDLKTAKALHGWLENYIRVAEEMAGSDVI
jgi:hypothetical protein